MFDCQDPHSVVVGAGSAIMVFQYASLSLETLLLLFEPCIRAVTDRVYTHSNLWTGAAFEFFGAMLPVLTVGAFLRLFQPWRLIEGTCFTEVLPHETATDGSDSLRTIQ